MSPSKKGKKQMPKKEKTPPVVFDPEIVEIIRRSIAPDLTDTELKVYLGVCRKYHADPIMKDIVPIVFTTKKHGRVLNFIITHDFLLKVANKDDKLDGLQAKIVRNEKGDITGATAICWKRGVTHPFETEVSFKEYYNSRNELWGSHPGAMICKVARVSVIKLAFNIDMLCDAELTKGTPSIQISDIQVPKTKFAISDAGKIKKKTVEVEDGEVL